MARALGERLGAGVSLLSSPVPRALQTAIALGEGMGTSTGEPHTLGALAEFQLANQERYNIVNSRLGWSGLMAAWVNGSLAPGVLRSCYEVSASAVYDALSTLERLAGKRAVAVTHDFVIMALAEAIFGYRSTEVPFMGGIVVNRQQAERLLALEVA